MCGPETRPPRGDRLDYRWQFRGAAQSQRRYAGDTSLMTYSQHRVARTLIRARFSPLHTTGQKYDNGFHSCSCLFLSPFLSLALFLNMVLMFSLLIYFCKCISSWMLDIYTLDVLQAVLSSMTFWQAMSCQASGHTLPSAATCHGIPTTCPFSALAYVPFSLLVYVNLFWSCLVGLLRQRIQTAGLRRNLRRHRHVCPWTVFCNSTHQTNISIHTHSKCRSREMSTENWNTQPLRLLAIWLAGTWSVTSCVRLMPFAFVHLDRELLLFSSIERLDIHWGDVSINALVQICNEDRDDVNTCSKHTSTCRLRVAKLGVLFCHLVTKVSESGQQACPLYL